MNRPTQKTDRAPRVTPDRPRVPSIDLALPITPTTPCPYLPDRQAAHECFIADSLEPELYHKLMDEGFRRSGRIFYRDRCVGCHECRPIRVPVGTFRASKSQRRVQRRNADVRVTVGKPTCTLAKWSLFCDYLSDQHDGRMIREFDDFRAFLYDSSVNTIEFCYFAGETLVAVSIADRCSLSLSSVYVYFDPAQAWRSLGVFSGIWEIEYCRRDGIPYYYLGLYVREAPTMRYKARFRPCEIMTPDGRWVPAEARSSSDVV